MQHPSNVAAPHWQHFDLNVACPATNSVEHACLLISLEHGEEAVLLWIVRAWRYSLGLQTRKVLLWM